MHRRRHAHRKPVSMGSRSSPAAATCLWNFLTSTTNKRTDEYGGDLAGGSRLFIEIIEAVRAQVGADYPITCRLAAREYGASPGFTLRDTTQVLLGRAEKAGLDGVTATAIGGDAVALPVFPGPCFPSRARSSRPSRCR